MTDATQSPTNIEGKDERTTGALRWETSDLDELSSGNPTFAQGGGFLGPPNRSPTRSPRRRPGRLHSLPGLALGALLSAGCRGGLPPVPPQLDPANPAAGAPTYTPLPDPYEDSAFEEEELKSSDEHHHHGGHDGGGVQEDDGVRQEDDGGHPHGEAEHGKSEHGKSEPDS